MLHLQDKLVRTVVANYVLWPAAHFINFKFVPGEHRILYNNCVSVSAASYLMQFGVSSLHAPKTPLVMWSDLHAVYLFL